MAYRDDVNALSPDHYWVFDSTSGTTDQVGSANLTGSSWNSGTRPVVTEDASNASGPTSTAGAARSATSTLTITGALARKAIGGWFRCDRVQPPPKQIYAEGSTGDQFKIVMWAGNALMAESVEGSTITQLFGQQVVQPDRAYHLFVTFEGTGFGDFYRFYVDGVLQDETALGIANLASTTGAAELGDPAGTSEVGNQTVILNAPFNAEFQFWASWGDKTLPTPTEIREELFEKGARPGTTISAGTEAAMQTSLDALADSVRGDEPLNIRVETVTGDGTLNLSADNITHDPLASIHVQYMGTGTLNWTNTNGANSSIGSTPNGGTINFINPAVLTASPLIAGSEVRFYEGGTTTEIAGVESSGTSFNSSISVNTVDVVVHKEDYEYIRVEGVDMTSGDVNLPIRQIFDRNYENP